MDNIKVYKSESAAIIWIAEVFGWLKSHARTVLLAGAGFHILVLLVMMFPPIMTLMTGETILLKVVPVDPRDIFRGEYVVLNYEFSSLPRPGITGFQSVPEEGEDVFVALMPDDDGKHWRASEFTLQRPSDGIYLSGRITGRNQIEFGIESYFVEEGEGLEYEEAARTGTLSAEVAIGRNGKAILKRLVVNP